MYRVPRGRRSLADGSRSVHRISSPASASTSILNPTGFCALKASAGLVLAGLLFQVAVLSPALDLLAADQTDRTHTQLPRLRRESTGCHD